MGVFENAKYAWKDHELIIPADKIMRAIATVEGHLTLHDITDQMISGNVRMTQVAMAYTALLRYAASLDPKHRDLQIEVEEIYDELFPTRDEDAGNFLGQKQSALVHLLMLMTPPKKYAERLRAVSGGPSPGKDTPTVKGP